MNVKWLGTATILIENEGEKILIDPYLAMHSANAFDFSNINYNDVKGIFITHPHFDHFADIGYFGDQTNCRIYVNERGIAIAKKEGLNTQKFCEIKHGDTLQIGKFEVSVYQGRHIEFDKKLERETLKRILFDGKTRQAKEFGKLAKIYSISPADVLCFFIKHENENVFVMGSADIDESTTYPSDIDTLVLPYQGRSDICTHSLKLLSHLKPKKVILDHFDDAFPPISAYVDTEEFIRLAEKEMGVSVIAPER